MEHKLTKHKELKAKKHKKGKCPEEEVRVGLKSDEDLRESNSVAGVQLSVCDNDSSCVEKRKKKKKRKKMGPQDVEDEATCAKLKSEEHMNDTETNDVKENIQLLNSESVRKKKKKDKNTGIQECVERDSVEIEHCTNTVNDTNNERSKKSKRNRRLENPNQNKTVDAEVKKKKKKTSGPEQTMENRIEKDECGVERKTSMKTSEIADKVRNVSESDQTKKGAGGNRTEESTTFVGQWGTAKFENAERKHKFLRLLGGMKSTTDKEGAGGATRKKGLFGGLASLVTERQNNAMTKDEQMVWQSNMENQFEKALAYKAQRGGGLGFEKPPGEGKKFHIDVNKTNSIQFDD